MTSNPHRPEPPSDDDRLSPAQSARLISEQRAALEKSIAFTGAPLYFLWGVVWLVGFGAMWAASVGWWPAGVRVGWAGVILATALAVGLVGNARYVYTSSRGIRGRSASVGTWYGCSWALGFGAVFALGSGLVRAGATSDVIGLYYTIAPAALVGVLYVVGGVLFEDRDWSILGVIVVAVVIGAAVTGSDLAMLIMSLAGGGVMIAGGVVTTVAARRRRARLWDDSHD